MGDNNLGGRAVRGTLWAAADRFGTMALQFGVNLVLARLLAPADFGAIGMVMIFILVSQVLVDGGFSSALIQRKEAGQTEFSTIFYWNVAAGALLYLALYAAAPWVAAYYRMEVLRPVLRVLGIVLIFNSIISVQTTRLQKTLEFGRLAAVDVATALAGGAVAVAMALAGWGVWSLVAMMLAQGVAKIALFYWATRWLPSLSFSRRAFRRLLGFGGYLFCANLLQVVCQNVQGVIIGKRFSATQMGLYTQADKLNSIVGYTLPQVIVQVMYPVYAQIQDDRERLAATMAMNLRVISFAIFPLLLMLILVAEPLVGWLYGEAWLAAAPYFRILCVGSMFGCLTNVCYYGVAAVGRSRQLFLWSFYKWGVLLVLLLVAMGLGMTALMWAIVAGNANIFAVNALLARRWVGLRLRRVVGAVAPAALLGGVLLAAMELLPRVVAATVGGGVGLELPWPVALLLYAALYLAVARLMRLRALGEAAAVARRLLPRRR